MSCLVGSNSEWIDCCDYGLWFKLSWWQIDPFPMLWQGTHLVAGSAFELWNMLCIVMRLTVEYCFARYGYAFNQLRSALSTRSEIFDRSLAWEWCTILPSMNITKIVPCFVGALGGWWMILSNFMILSKFMIVLLSDGEVGRNFWWTHHCLAITEERCAKIFLVLIYVDEKGPGSLS